MNQHFPLAPMNRLIAISTTLGLFIPLAFLIATFLVPSQLNLLMLGVLCFLLLIYASVWFWFRPTRFVIDEVSLKIMWPLRTKSWKRSELTSVKIVSGEEFNKSYGYGVRIGAGGLWGGFGLLKTSKKTFVMYVSRTDRFVLLDFQTGRSLLISPDRAEEFIACLKTTA